MAARRSILLSGNRKIADPRRMGRRTNMTGRFPTPLAAVLAALAFAATSLGVTGAAADRPQWIRQFGTWSAEEAWAVETGSGGTVHVAGGTAGRMTARKGSWDAYVVTFDSEGRELWRRQPGTESYDAALDVATDADGNVYLVGETRGALGGPRRGDFDAFIIKLDAAGGLLWKRQPGTSEIDSAQGAATDADGNVYMVGRTYGSLAGSEKGGEHDPFVIKFDRDGATLWSRQPGTTGNDDAASVAADINGDVYVFGTTATLDGYSSALFVIKFDRDGGTVWRRPLTAEGQHRAGRIALDTEGNIYLTGHTTGRLGGSAKGGVDAFLIKLDRSGSMLWRRQPGGSPSDFASGVASDPAGNVHIAGGTAEVLDGRQTAGDVPVMKLDPDGQFVWRDLPGIPAVPEFARDIAIAADGTLYVAGTTRGALGGSKLGPLNDRDAFLIKY
jgi:hypothetical protein